MTVYKLSTGANAALVVVMIDPYILHFELQYSFKFSNRKKNRWLIVSLGFRLRDTC